MINPPHWKTFQPGCCCCCCVASVASDSLQLHRWQSTLSLGFSRQEHWSTLPFPSPMHESEKWQWRHSVMSNSVQPHRQQPPRLPCPWDFPGKSPGVECHCLLLNQVPQFYMWRWVRGQKARWVTQMELPPHGNLKPEERRFLMTLSPFSHWEFSNSQVLIRLGTLSFGKDAR